MMQLVRWIVAAVVFIALLFLSFQNADTVTLRFFNLASWQAPLVFVVLIAFAAGVAAGLLAGALRSARLSRQLSRLRREQHKQGGKPNAVRNAVAPGTSPASGPGFMHDDRSHDGH
jgi:lipopolysaccharide assembly protein A